jgi:hypothetical protein
VAIFLNTGGDHAKDHALKLMLATLCELLYYNLNFLLISFKISEWEKWLDQDF